MTARPPKRTAGSVTKENSAKAKILNPVDLRRLQDLVELGHKLEKDWPSGGHLQSEPSEIDLISRLGLRASQLRAAIGACAEASSEALARLAFHERDITDHMSGRHLAAVLVPFERLLNRSLRDDEFLVSEVDRADLVAPRTPLVVIADNLRSSFNVGAILRTSECYGVGEVILCGYTPSPENEKTARTSMGTEKYVNWRSEPRSVEVLTQLKSDGYKIIALETAQVAETLTDFTWPDKPAILLGNERFGIDHDLLAQADKIVKIPLRGNKNSLNVGIALGIVLADWDRQERSKVRASAPEQTVRAVPRPNFAPIGVFRTSKKHRYEARRQGVDQDLSETGLIELNAKSDFEQAVQDLSGFERIWLIYQFHQNETWKPMVLPPRGPRMKRGVFATRAPYRPNPIGLSCVELILVEGRNIYVKGFDLLDETPILDIKPYLPYADSFPGAKTGWLEGVATDAYEVNLSEKATVQLEWLESQGLNHLRGFAFGQLEFAPLDRERKRVVLGTDGSGEGSTGFGNNKSSLKSRSDSSNRHVLAYRTWRLFFQVSDKHNMVIITEIQSGYREEELRDPSDLYDDKILHRAYCAKFAKT